MIELLIYIVLFTIVSLLIGKQFSGLMTTFKTGKQVTRQQAGTRDILGLMVREIRNTGLKVYLTQTSGSYAKHIAYGTYVSSTDSSSFSHSQSGSGTYGDTLTIYLARLTGSGSLDGIDTITYYLDGTTLKRELTTGGNTSTSIVAGNVFALQFEYGIYGKDTILFKDSTTYSANWTVYDYNGNPNPTDPTITSSSTSPLVLTFTGAARGYIQYINQKPVVKNRKYSLLLQITPSGGFPDALDSMCIEFMDGDGTTLCGYEKFRPYGGDLRITLPASNSGTADIRLRFGSSGAGVLSIRSVVATCSGDSAYTWVNRFPTEPDSTMYKKEVGAIRVHVLTRTSGKAGTKATGDIAIADVTVPRPGEFTWRYYTELVEIPNNGRF